MELKGTPSAKGKNHVEAISTDTVEAISTILFKMLQQHMLVVMPVTRDFLLFVILLTGKNNKPEET